VDVFVPVEMGEAFEALRPGLQRLARAKPLRRQLTAEALHGMAPSGALAVIAGACEAAVAPRAPDEGTGERERARLEKELADAERLLAAARSRLADPDFTSKAPPKVVAGVCDRETELVSQVARIVERLAH
jgi:valyl-tRNA synthetase